MGLTIPNREVKPISADSTATVGSRSPFFEAFIFTMKGFLYIII